MATLADLARQYLNQALPDISGIFTLPQASMPIVEEETIAAPGLTPEQLVLLYPQNQSGGDDPVNTGFGLFNNLDKNDVRYEVVNGELLPTYRNVVSGLYQTEQGKNVSNLGLSTPSSEFFEGIFGAKTPPEFPGYFQQDPDTRGSFIDFITGRTRRNKVEAFKAGQGGDRSAQRRQKLRDDITKRQANERYRDDPGAKSYSGGFDKSTGNYDDPFSPGDTE